MRATTPRRLSLLLASTLALTAGLALPATAQEASPSPAPDATASPSAEAATAAPGAAEPTASPAALDECVEPEVTPEPLTDQTLSMPEEFRIAIFTGVWEGIRDYYVDPQTNGLDWEAIGDEYGPLVLSTDNAYEVYELMSEMVGLLDDPFTNFFAPEELGDPETIDPTYGGIGALLDTSTAGEESPGLRIIYVFEGGSAKDTGIRPRDSIVAVEGDPCARIVDIRGPEGTEVTVTIATPGQPLREVTLERRRIDPLILPEARRLETDPAIGYLQVLALSGQEAIDGIEQALTTFLRDEPIEGLILDLRASSQGAPAVVVEVLRTFVDGRVGEYRSRTGGEEIVIEPDDLAADYEGIPLVVLVDEETEADAEQLAAILQDQGRATIVGEQTSGQTHGATTVDFPDGSLLQIVVFGFSLPDGRSLEGVGVTPDVPVDADWLAYPESDDPFILAALEVLEEARSATEEVASPMVTPSPSAAPAGQPVG